MDDSDTSFNDYNDRDISDESDCTTSSDVKSDKMVDYGSAITDSVKQKSNFLSRSSSTLSLAQSSTRSCSPVTVTDVRTLTDNYQKMLSQATQEIKNLNIQKTNLEMEQENLLTVNIELATEAKRLVKDNKMWKDERVVSVFKKYY